MPARSTRPQTLVLALLVSCGCATAKAKQAATLDTRLAKLEAEEQRRTQRLSALESEIEAAEVTLAAAQDQARLAQCRAQRAVIEAELTEAAARCGAQIAEHEVCLARNEAKVSKGAAVGCGLGILSAVVTGGATAPLAVAGCTGGAVVGKARSRACGAAPGCYPQVQAKRKQTIRELSALATCHESPGSSIDPRPSPRPRSTKPRPAPGVRR